MICHSDQEIIGTTIILATNKAAAPEEFNANDRYNFLDILTAHQANTSIRRMRKQDIKRLRERLAKIDIFYHWNHRKYYHKDEWPEK